jgi:nickel-dependent lactate racemase
MTQTLSLPWGKNESLSIQLPAEWEIISRLEPAARPGVSDPTAEVCRSLANPIGLPRLSELANGKTRIALVIDDSSRPTPVRQILPPILEELKAAGVEPRQISLIPAVGLHRVMSQIEVAERIGMADLGGMRLVTHDCDDPGLIHLGRTNRGTEVLINAAVANAELVITVNCIEPHLIASFGGGYKSLFPGLAGRRTIAHNHTLNCHPNTFNMTGQPIAANPMRLDLEEAGEMVKPPVFLVNAVLNSAAELVEVVSGHPIQAHREGVKICASIYGVALPRKADVVITDSFPMDTDFRQGAKALANTIRAVRPGGVLLGMIRAEEGLGVFGLANRKLPLGRSGMKLVAPILLPLIPKLKLKGVSAEDKFLLYYALQALRTTRILVYAPTVPAENRARLIFFEFVTKAQEAVNQAIQSVGGHASVLVFPHGGSTYPVL